VFREYWLVAELAQWSEGRLSTKKLSTRVKVVVKAIDILILALSGSSESRISIDRSAVSLQASASCAIALMRMRKASRKIRRLTPTSALSSLFRVDSQAANSALASSSFAECSSKALSEVGVFLPLSLTSFERRFVSDE
jgi:hypothetical protein